MFPEEYSLKEGSTAGVQIKEMTVRYKSSLFPLSNIRNDCRQYCFIWGEPLFKILRIKFVKRPIEFISRA